MKASIAQIRSSSFVRQGALVFGASTFVNAAGFVFHMISSRALGVAEYGTLYALISTMTLACAPAGIVMPVITRFAAEFRALADWSHLRGLSLGLARAFGAVAVVAIAATVIGAVPFGAALHAPGWSIPTVGLLLAIVLASGAYRALAQGVHDFEGFAISSVAEGIAKIAATVVFVAVGWHLFGALVGFVVGSFVGLAFIVQRVLKRALRYPEEPVRYDWRRIAIAGAGSAALAVAAGLLGNVDVIVVKHAFDAHQAGIYSAASLGGKIMLYGFGFLPAVLLPVAADRRARGESTRGVLAACCAAVAGLGAIGLAIFHFFGVTIVRLLVGTQFDAAASLLVWYGAAMIFVALLTLLGSYGIATHRLLFGWSTLGGSIATAVVIGAFHPSLEAVVVTLTVGAAATTLATAASIGAQALYAERMKAAA